jgi:hypothetical protein
MTIRTNLSAIIQGVSSFLGLTNSEQPNLPLPQPIAETAQPLTDRTVEVISAMPQPIEDSVEELICTPEKFKQLLSENYQFPPKVEVRGYLKLCEYTSLTSLPQGLKVRGDLELYGCTGLTSLPQDLEVGGSLNLSGCTNLISLPQGLKVGGDLYLCRCTSLTSLPQDLEVGGDLDLSGCTNLISLPQGLKVGGDLSLCQLRSLTSLPQGLKVGRNLFLPRCTGLTSLPQDLEVGGDLNLDGCTSLTSLPSWITTLGRDNNGYTRNVYLLENTGLSDAIIERLRQTDAPGMQFYFSHRATNPTIRFSNLGEALAFWHNEAKDETLVIPNIVFNREIDRANVVHFLARLTTTAEYKNLHTRQHLAGRILEIFNQIAPDEALKGAACVLIHEGLTSCDDRIISALEEIELMLLLDKIEKTNHTAEELKKLGKSFLLLEMVNAKAKAHKETLTWVDEIEIYLAFQISLADRFDLPVKSRNMFFRGCAQVTSEQLQAIGDQIEQACTDEKLEAFLQIWSPWIKFQKQAQVIPAYEELAVADRELADDDTCVITLCAPDQPVLYKGRVYDYGALIYQYRTSGIDPVDRSKIDISKLKRIIFPIGS